MIRRVSLVRRPDLVESYWVTRTRRLLPRLSRAKRWPAIWLGHLPRNRGGEFSALLCKADADLPRNRGGEFSALLCKADADLPRNRGGESLLTRPA